MSSGECVKTLTGHFESVEGVCLVTLVEEGNKKRGSSKWIVSVSLDGTLRRWRLDGEDDAQKLERTDVDGENVDASSGKAGKAKVLATEEEDQELADLMAELEDDD